MARPDVSRPPGAPAPAAPRRAVAGLAVQLALATTMPGLASMPVTSMPDALRILALGDSYTIGESVAVDERWPVQLAARLRARGLDVAAPQIVARTGWTTDELAAGMEAAELRPPYDLVTLLIGVNNQYRGREVGEYARQFRGLLERAVVLAGGDTGRVLVLSIPDWGVTPFAADRDAAAIAAEIDAFNDAARRIVRERDVRWVDVTPISREAADAPRLVADDGLHPSAAMYERWVQLAFYDAERILRQARRPARAFVGATLFDGRGGEGVADAVLLVRDGRVAAAGPRDRVQVPGDAETIDLAGAFVVPGLVNAHGHVGDTVGLDAGNYSRQNVLRQLGLYARYGVTTVVSLGGDGPEARAIRDAQGDPALDRARLFYAGPVISASTPEEARARVDEAAGLDPDWIKFRVDDNLGATTKMPPEVYRAIIDRAHELDIPVATHLFYLEDAKGLLRAGTDLVAHSVRDRPVDDELIDLLRERSVCYVPTLTREVSTFVYGDEPEFFDDPFFLAEVEPAVLEELRDPDRQERIRESPASAAYREALQVAQANLARLVEAGVPVAMGTDSGPPARFQGYFEHLEAELMAEAGMAPAQVLRSATGTAADCLGLDELGVLEAGRWADFLVLDADPLEDVRHLRTIREVRIAGNVVPGSQR